MAGRSGPSFLKRQKEQKRLEKAAAKRAAQQARRERRSTPQGNADPLDDGIEPFPAHPDDQDASPEGQAAGVAPADGGSAD